MDRDFPCQEPDCDYKGKKRNYLTKHVDSVHKKIKFSCKDCDYKAANKGKVAFTGIPKQFIQEKHFNVKTVIIG